MPTPEKKIRKRKNVPFRKRLKHTKRHVKKADQVEDRKQEVDHESEGSNKAPSPQVEVDTNQEECRCHGSDGSVDDIAHVKTSIMSPLSLSIPDISEESMDISDIISPIFSPISSTSSSLCSTPQPPPCTTPQPPEQGSVLDDSELRALLLEVRDKLSFMLPQFFVPVVDNKGIHVLMIGRRESKAVQREVFVSSSGQVRIEVHGRAYPAYLALRNVPGQKPLTAQNLAYFVDRTLSIVSSIRLMDICAGCDKKEFKEAWYETDSGDVETDIFKECRYTETLRSKKCSLLVDVATWRCKECQNLQKVLKRRSERMKCESPQLKTNNRYLTKKQKEKKLEEQQKAIKSKSKTIDRLHDRMNELISKEGVKISSDLSNDLQEILQSSNLTIKQSQFFQQQFQAIKLKKSCGMRWHPTMIRLALSIYLRSPSAYKILQESGFVKLPTSRTLFDYSHATKIQPGIDCSVVESLAKRVSAENLKHPQYHVVMADEMHLSKNLVIQKSTGEIIGFKDLDKIDEEVATLDTFIDDSEKTIEPQLASKMLSFMVKGCSTKIKDVVASFPVCNPTPKQLYVWTWEVIGALERSGIKVTAFVCDGAPSNRAFIKLHQPATTTISGIIFDTVNKFAPERLLYFFSDVPHLLKTIRNAFFNSRRGNKGVRCLQKGGELIVWDTIIRLYLSKKEKILRKSYKLNQQNVFPDSYSRMKVAPAAQVMSRTVGNDIVSQGWPQTTETVEFIWKTNDWFDLLNGAFIAQGTKTQNPRLNAYTIKDVEEFENSVKGNRFQQILDYVQYHSDWYQEIESKLNVSLFDDLGVQPLDVSFHALPEEDFLDPNNAEEPANNVEVPNKVTNEVSMKCLLPHQTLLGIEMSSKSFIGAVTFLMKEGVPFVNARAFCQDPLEHNFGKQRMGGGGSCNPNVYQYFHKQRAIHTIGQLGTLRERSGNTEVLQEEADISNEPLAKRRKSTNIFSV